MLLGIAHVNSIATYSLHLSALTACLAVLCTSADPMQRHPPDVTPTSACTICLHNSAAYHSKTAASQVKVLVSAPAGRL